MQEHAPRTTFVLKSCDFQAGAAADQGGIEPATAGLRKQARKPRDNFQRPFRERENCMAPQQERFDTHNLRRGFAETKTNLHGATARALRRARSPQRVHPGMSKTPRPRRSPQRVARAPPPPKKKKKKKTQNTLSFCTSTTPISADGRAGNDKNAKNLKFLYLDHADPRRGSHSRSSATSPPPALKEILNTELFLFP